MLHYLKDYRKKQVVELNQKKSILLFDCNYLRRKYLCSGIEADCTNPPILNNAVYEIIPDSNPPTARYSCISRYGNHAFQDKPFSTCTGFDGWTVPSISCSGIFNLDSQVCLYKCIWYLKNKIIFLFLFIIRFTFVFLHFYYQTICHTVRIFYIIQYFNSILNLLTIHDKI